MNEEKKLYLIIPAFAAIYFIWGSTYLGVKWAIESIPPLTMAGLRSLAAGLILFLFVFRQLKTNPLKVVHIKSSLIVGFFNFTIAHGIFAWAMMTVPSGLAALVSATLPIWMVLLDWLWKKNYKPTGKALFGLILGFFGMAMLIGPARITDYSDGSILLIIIMFLAPVSWATGSVYSKTAQLHSSVWISSSLQMILGGGMLFLVSVCIEGTGAVDFSGISLKSILAVFYLVFVGSILAYTTYIWLLNKVSIAKVSTYTYANAIIGMFLGWLLGNEHFTLRTILSAVIIISAIVIIVSERSGAKTIKVKM